MFISLLILFFENILIFKKYYILLDKIVKPFSSKKAL